MLLEIDTVSPTWNDVFGPVVTVVDGITVCTVVEVPRLVLEPFVSLWEIKPWDRDKA
jgi:hypothetical protein